MYNEIEDIYKNKSPHNIIKKRMFWIYAIFIFISLIFNILNKVLPMIFVFVAMLITMKYMCEKVLKTKLHLSIGKNKDNEVALPLIIKNAEIKQFKDYSMKNKLYNEKSLLCIINHYRNMIKTKMIGGNLLAILSIVIPVVLSFYTKEGFDFNELANALPYLISFCVMIIIFYFSYNQFIEVKKILKGEDGMIERLEEIFSELYMECINTNNDKQEISKKKAKKKQKTSKKK